MHTKNYIPAVSFDWLTRFYDPLIRWTMPERAFKSALIEQARLEDGQRILDVGCGTGTLLIMMKEACPGIEAVGVDGDPNILGIAGFKIEQGGFSIEVREAMAFELPFPDAHFDRVVSSLVLHHLTTEDKTRALMEIYRVLRPNGELHVADFGKPHNALMRALALLVQSLEHSTDNVEGRIPDLFRAAGFTAATEVDRRATLFGTLSLYSGRKELEKGRTDENCCS